MKNDVSTPMAIAIVVAVLAVIGGLAWFFMFREPKAGLNAAGAAPTGDAARQPGLNTPAGGQFSKPGVD
jgi:hypothetical protein